MNLEEESRPSVAVRLQGQAKRGRWLGEQVATSVSLAFISVPSQERASVTVDTPMSVSPSV